MTQPQTNEGSNQQQNDQQHMTDQRQQPVKGEQDATGKGQWQQDEDLQQNSPQRQRPENEGRQGDLDNK